MRPIQRGSSWLIAIRIKLNWICESFMLYMRIEYKVKSQFPEFNE